MKTNFKSGFISLIGRPNVGKSTLLNHLIGNKIAIVSDKPQTTRNQIRGILTKPNFQAVFLDTPGIHKPGSKLGERLVNSAVSSFTEVDLILFLIDPAKKIGPGDKYIMEQLAKIKTPVFLVINKIDQINPDELLPLIETYKEFYNFKEYIPISAQLGSNTDRLVDLILSNLPEGPQYYPTDQSLDHPERFLMAEIIREKILQLTREEVPHSVAVVIQHLEVREDNKNIVDVHATIFTERSSQKGILIGKNGLLLKEVGKRARRDIEKLLGSRIYLDLWVKVEKDWRNKERRLQEFGYE